jgi:hypothetical protein
VRKMKVISADDTARLARDGDSVLVSRSNLRQAESVLDVIEEVRLPLSSLAADLTLDNAVGLGDWPPGRVAPLTAVKRSPPPH